MDVKFKFKTCDFVRNEAGGKVFVTSATVGLELEKSYTILQEGKLITVSEETLTTFQEAKKAS